MTKPFVEAPEAGHADDLVTALEELRERVAKRRSTKAERTGALKAGSEKPKQEDPAVERTSIIGDGQQFDTTGMTQEEILQWIREREAARRRPVTETSTR